MSKRITMRDVANAAGFHVTTVSLALRNSPRISDKTRRCIQELAQQMGYRPNPLVVAFVQQRRKLPAGVSLAFVCDVHPVQEKIVEYTPLYFEHAQKRAYQLGFRLEQFNLSDYNHDCKRLQKVFTRRNIVGVIIAPLPEIHKQLEFDWDHLAAVAIGRNLVNPSLDYVCPDIFGGSILALEMCEAAGYKRPAYLSLSGTEQRTQGRWKGGYLAYEPRSKGFRRLKPFVHGTDTFSARVRDWISQHQPDIILATESTLKTCEHELESPSFKKIAKLRLNIHDLNDPMPGIYTGFEFPARSAVDMLASKLYQNETGIPEHPHALLIPPIWHSGTMHRM